MSSIKLQCKFSSAILTAFSVVSTYFTHDLITQPELLVEPARDVGDAKRGVVALAVLRITLPDGRSAPDARLPDSAPVASQSPA